jgi:uncharacterized protein YggE
MRSSDRLVLIVALVVALFALWQATGASTKAHRASEPSGPSRYGQEGLRVSGTAVVRASPDVATVRLGYESRALKARPARVQNDETMKKVLAAIEKAGVDRKDIQTVEYRLFPMWEDWPKPTMKVWVWHVLHMVEVRVRNVDTVSDVIDAASGAGADKMENVQFWVDDLHKLRGQAREMAIKVAQEKAEQLAKLTGSSLGKVVAITDNAPGASRWWYGGASNVQAQAVSEEPLAVAPDSVVRGGQVVVQVTEDLVFAIQ